MTDWSRRCIGSPVSVRVERVPCMFPMCFDYSTPHREEATQQARGHLHALIAV